VTEIGLAPGLQPAWWASWSPPQRLQERYGETIAAQLIAGDAALLEQEHLPTDAQVTLFGAQSGRIVPMRLGEELVGILMVAYAEPDHSFSEEELALTGTLAKLGALVLERNQLLRGWAETRGRELALAETKAQMDTFLGIASHELKTPLTSLKLSLQVTQRHLHALTRSRALTGAGAIPDHEQARFVGAVEQLGRTARQMERMEALVNDLVDVSRIQAGKLELHTAPVDLVALVAEAIREQQQAQPERSLQILVPSELVVPVEMDAGRIEQVVTNFLTNALKYSPADRPVAVGIALLPAATGEGAEVGGDGAGAEEAEQVRVWVRDEGPGLPLLEQEQIWERFHRVQGVEVQTGTGVGLGLGLHISRMIIERHHGQVGVESLPGQGATFWFTLPVSRSGKKDH
jgi:signal transduction histidine kinase